MGDLVGKCEACGAENVKTQRISVGYRDIDACEKCHDRIEKDNNARMLRLRMQNK